ncbi:MAG: cytochrome c oxidase accessory protein FixG [Bradymonadia bacterium]|jgi:cytochrome c oxidase accessory protein FixG
MLANLATRKLFFMGMVLTPRDSILMLLLLLTTGFFLFFVTSLWGRIWCGFACPQTVFLEEIVRRIERWVEGERGARIRLDKAQWSREKVRTRVTKWFLFLVVSALVSASFIGFFSDPRIFWTGRALPATYGVASALAFVLYLDFAWFREQFCHYLCPYARFQGVMTDETTLQIGYDLQRGEPRKPRGMKLCDLDAMKDQGDCVDCNRCVTVCPSGIDIRDGFQLECIACARCVDACTIVMERLDKKTLVRYGSMAEFEGKPTDRKRLRAALYGVVTSAMALALVVAVIGRSSFDVTIAQDAATAATMVEDGRIQNLYQLTIHNNGQDIEEYEISVSLADAELVIPGGTIIVPPAGRRMVPAFVRASEDAFDGSVTAFEFHVENYGHVVSHDAMFRTSMRH